MYVTGADCCVVAGTPEAGGWTTREVKRIIRGLSGLNFVYVQFLLLCTEEVLIVLAVVLILLR